MKSRALLFISFFNDTATTEIYPLSLHDALPISALFNKPIMLKNLFVISSAIITALCRAEEHTSELQSRLHLVCRLLLDQRRKQTQRQQHASDGTPGAHQRLPQAHK